MSKPLIEQIEDELFVAGQMDAQGSAAEKRKIGSGGPTLAISKRLLMEARADLDLLARSAGIDRTAKERVSGGSLEWSAPRAEPAPHGELGASPDDRIQGAKDTR